MIIAIDGPAASGKGTLGKKLAAHYGLRHLDSGLLYRAVAKSLIDANKRSDDVAAAVAAAKTLDLASFDEAALKTPAVGEAASIVSAFPEVRAALVALQRDFAAQQPGAVLDGRDIGTVICPNADVKIFVTAKPEVRAAPPRRRISRRGPRDRRWRRAGGHHRAGQTRHEPRHGTPETGAGCALARYYGYGYIHRIPGRHRHRRGYPSGPRARLTAPRCWRTPVPLESLRKARPIETIVPKARF